MNNNNFSPIQSAKNPTIKKLLMPFQDIVDISKQNIVKNEEVPVVLDTLIRTGVNIDYTTPYDLRVYNYYYYYLIDSCNDIY